MAKVVHTGDGKERGFAKNENDRGFINGNAKNPVFEVGHGGHFNMPGEIEK